MSTPTFIVGTGRCGSTLLSNMLNEHPMIASLSEFFAGCSDFGARNDALFPTHPVDGEYVWDCIGTVKPRSDVMVKHRLGPPEALYPYDDPRSRFDRHTGVPQILQVTLPHLSRDFDDVFEELKPHVIGFDTAPMRTQYERLFGWLRDRFGKKLWVERSGASFAFMKLIDRTFPDARYVHVVRDGRDAALSMSDHSGFKMVMIGVIMRHVMGVDPFYSDDRDNVDTLPSAYRNFLPETFDSEAFERFRFPALLMGRVWSDQVEEGLGVLRGIDRDRVLVVRFEDLLEEPRPVLESLAGFLDDECVLDSWLKRASEMVGRPRSSWKELNGAKQRVLQKACAPGFKALEEYGVTYPDTA